jgi:hypothetical protein
MHVPKAYVIPSAPHQASTLSLTSCTTPSPSRSNTSLKAETIPPNTDLLNTELRWQTRTLGKTRPARPVDGASSEAKDTQTPIHTRTRARLKVVIPTRRSPIKASISHLTTHHRINSLCRPTRQTSSSATTQATTTPLPQDSIKLTVKLNKTLPSQSQRATINLSTVNLSNIPPSMSQQAIISPSTAPQAYRTVSPSKPGLLQSQQVTTNRRTTPQFHISVNLSISRSLMSQQVTTNPSTILRFQRSITSIRTRKSLLVCRHDVPPRIWPCQLDRTDRTRLRSCRAMRLLAGRTSTIRTLRCSNGSSRSWMEV